MPLASGVVLRDTPPLQLGAARESAASPITDGVSVVNGGPAYAHVYELVRGLVGRELRGLVGVGKRGLEANPNPNPNQLGLAMVANVREAYSAVRLLCSQHDLVRAYNLRPAEISEVGEERGLSPHGFCCTLTHPNPNPDPNPNPNPNPKPKP